jgi:hypothetical protein
MVKLRIVRFPRVRHVYVSQSRLVPDGRADNQLIAAVALNPAPDATIDVSPNQVDEPAVAQPDAKPAVTLPQDEEAERKSEADKQADKQDALLVKEVDETNNWARLGAQLYFGWFTLMLTVNGLATGWLFTNRGRVPPFARLIFLIFVVLNLMGTIVTILLRKHMLESDRRIQDVLTGLLRDHQRGDHFFAPQSPMPRQAINTVFFFTGAALFMLLLFWIILALWPETFLT